MLAFGLVILSDKNQTICPIETERRNVMHLDFFFTRESKHSASASNQLSDKYEQLSTLSDEYEQF